MLAPDFRTCRLDERTIVSHRSIDIVELVPETLQAFTRSLQMQDTTVTPQQAVAAAAAAAAAAAEGQQR